MNASSEGKDSNLFLLRIRWVNCTRKPGPRDQLSTFNQIKKSFLSVNLTEINDKAVTKTLDKNYTISHNYDIFLYAYIAFQYSSKLTHSYI